MNVDLFMDPSDSVPCIGKVEPENKALGHRQKYKKQGTLSAQKKKKKKIKLPDFILHSWSETCAQSQDKHRIITSTKPL